MSEKAKLLIVDDEAIVRDSLGKWFREEGYEIVSVSGGEPLVYRPLVIGHLPGGVLIDERLSRTAHRIS